MRETTRSNVFKDFLNSANTGGILLLCCVVISLYIANSTLSESFSELLTTNLSLNAASGLIDLPLTLASFINDALMAVFFLLVGLEIKREMVNGELSTVKSATLPVVAALGGMIVPALIYYLFNHQTPAANGWGIPMATDIAFALAIITLLGKNVPASLKIFLAALAIVDDLGAILVIAIFYTTSIHLNYLIMAGGVILLLALLNYFKVKKLIFYLVPGVFLWYFVHHSGIHATIAGVILAFTIPVSQTNGSSPLEKLEHFLSKPVNLLIMPIFALANTNITFRDGLLSGLAEPLGLGIISGLFLGKTAGVTLFSWIAVKLKLGDLPTNASWKHILGLGMLAGIGFTMSIFIALLSFKDPDHQENAKFAVLIASGLSGILGYVYLRFMVKRNSIL